MNEKRIFTKSTNEAMGEKFEAEQGRRFSEGEVASAQGFVRKIREIVHWDLGRLCSTDEDMDTGLKARDAMQEVEDLFHVPKTKRWVDIPGKDMDDSVRKASAHNNQTLPREVIVLSLTDLEKLAANLGTIAELLGWDISASDEEEKTMLREARESLEALKKIL